MDDFMKKFKKKLKITFISLVLGLQIFHYKDIIFRKFDRI